MVTPRCARSALAIVAVFAVACSSDAAPAADVTAPPTTPAITPHTTPATTPAAEHEPADEQQRTADIDDTATALTRYDVDLAWDPALVAAVADPDDLPEPIVTSDELLQLGIDQGVWTEAEGAIALLEVVLGERDPASVPQFGWLGHHNLHDLVHRAEHRRDDPSVPADERARLTELLDALFPDPDDPLVVVEPSRLDAAQAGSGPAGLRSPDRGRCHRRRAIDPPHTADPGSEVSCWYQLVRDGEAKGRPYRLRVHYPGHWADTAGPSDPATAREEHARAVLDVMDEVNALFAAFDHLPAVSDIDLWFAQQDLSNIDEAGVAFENTTLATARPSDNAPCRVMVFPAAHDRDSFDLDLLRFVVAHEAVHCVQHAAWGTHPPLYVHEGGADFFAMQIVPEHTREPHLDRFDVRSLHHSLEDLSYEVWVFWQYLANEWSVPRVWRLHSEIATKGRQLADTQESDELDELFHRFVELWVSTGVPDVNGDLMPRRPARVLKGGHIDAPGDHVVEGIRPFQAMRVRYSYEPGRIIEQQDLSSGATSSALSSTAHPPDVWTRTLEPELVTPCDDPLFMTVVTTTGAPESVGQNLRIDSVELADCDTCLAGTWLLDNEHLGRVVFGLDGFDPDELAFWISYEGEHLLRFRPDGVLRVLRTGWGVVTDGEYGILANLSDVVEEARYVAADGRLDITDHRIADVRFPPDSLFQDVPEWGMPSMIGAAIDVFGDLLGPVPPPTDSAQLGYECSDDVLVFGALTGPAAEMWSRWDRVPDRPLPASLG